MDTTTIHLAQVDLMQEDEFICQTIILFDE
jgi:hypothetical protein